MVVKQMIEPELELDLLLYFYRVQAGETRLWTP